MKTAKLAAVAIMLSALLLFVLGWLTYHWLLDVIMAGSGLTLAVISINGVVVNQLWAALSFALLGVVTSACVLFFKRKTAAYISVMVGLILMAFASVAGWLFYMRHKIAFISHNFAISESPIKTVLAVEDIPVYEAAIYASLAVLLLTLLLVVWNKRERQGHRLG